VSGGGAGVPEIRVVSNGELRAGPVGSEAVPALAEVSPDKRAALLANPLLGPDDDAARLVAVVDERVVGQLDLVAGEITTPGGVVPCFWGSALHVSPEARGRGVGSALLQAAEEQREGAAACAPSRLSYPIYLRRGYFDLPLRRHILLRRTRPLADRWLGNQRLARAASALGDAGARGGRALLGVAGPGVADARLEPCETFPSELEPRLRERSAPFAMHRSAAWLDWVVGASFGYPSQRRALYLVRSARGEALGYLLVKARVYSGVTRWQVENLHLGSLVDWQIFEPSMLSFEQLVLLATEALEEWRVDAVEACAPPAEQARFGRLGFVPVGVQHLMLKGEGLARDAAQWSLRPGEGDHAFS